MTEPLDEFESELSRLRPQALSQGLRGRIAAQLDEPARIGPADRFLMTFMGAGALAASVIIGLLSWQMLENYAPRMASPAPAIAQYPRASMGEYQQALARSDGPALELFR